MTGPLVSDKYDFDKLKCDDGDLTINEAQELGMCLCCDPDWKCKFKELMK